MRNETKIYLLYMLTKITKLHTFCVLSHTGESSMEFIEICTYCTILWVGKYCLFFFEGKQPFDTSSG